MVSAGDGCSVREINRLLDGLMIYIIEYSNR